VIVWREKFLAFAIHFLVTLAFGACAAALIFLVWFPDPFQTMIGGTELFLLVVGCDLALGPLLSLVVYNSRKSRRALLIDYTVIGIVQLAALTYGVYVVAGTRPAYIAFTTDRIEIVSAGDISDQELAAARESRYRTLPLTGPRFVAVIVPAKEKQDAMFAALAGNEEQRRPRFYQPYDTDLAAIRAHAKPMDQLTRKFPAARPAFDAAVRKLRIPLERVRWLPVRHIKGFWTALIDTQSGRPVAYVPFDPYGPD
jgi:hypothetical protein